MDRLWIIIVAATVFVMVEVGNYILERKRGAEQEKSCQIKGV